MSANLKRVSPREHILLRPDMYIGSISQEQTRQWLVSPEGKLYISTAHVVPGLYKIFDEIITNSSDNKQRDSARGRNAQMSYIKVKFESTGKGTQITVENDGVEGFLTYNKEEKMYNPELAFGHLMTSTNYDDTEQRVTGGRNGFGAKLTNIYSSQFAVEVAENGQKYVQEWKSNMSQQEDYVITKLDSKRQNYIRVTFTPDYQKFGLTDLTSDNLALLSRRVYDIAGCCNNIKVSLNGKELPVHNFREYVQQMFCAASPEALKQQEAFGSAEAELLDAESTTNVTESTAVSAAKKRSKQNKHWTDEHIAYFEPNPFWSIAVFGSELREFQQISFVNSIFTADGGSHVEFVIDNLISPINDKVKDFLKKQDMKQTKDLTRAQIKQNIFLVIRSLVVNPSFDSQTKLRLQTSRTEIKKNLVFDDKTDKQCKDFFKQIGNMPILMQNLASLVSAQQQKALQKTDGQKTRHVIVPKLDDAIDAGTGSGGKCFLYLTEGDSAKTLAVEGISKLPDGRRYNGVFPLRGKVLNVRDCAAEKVKDNAEIANLKKILGLRQDLDYSNAENRKTLRYGKVVIMTDQDTDGSHIKGLLLNLFDTYWPALLKCGYIQEFITPIVRVRKNGRNEQPVDFYSIPEFQKWLTTIKNPKEYSTQYYKGLGSSDKSEAIEYFKKIQQNKKQFVYDANSSLRLNMAFNKKLADKRKDWLRGADPTAFLDNKADDIKISEFVDKELVLYELDNIKRSIPSMIDGFKPSQRKILFACFKRKLTSAIKVAQLSGYVSEHAAYHHGEQSLNATIVNLAQGFTGSNNIPLLVPKGQFGSRPRGGKDSAAPRYIFTQLQPITRYIFVTADDAILNEQKDDNQVIEPEFYVPIIPLILVNGGAGIGTGWSTSVPQFNPLEIINAVRRRLMSKSTRAERYGKNQMQPWYRNWSGKVQTNFIDVNKQKVEKWVFQGTFEVEDDKTLTITELPPGVWTEEYKEELLKWIAEKDKDKASKRPELVGINDYSDNDRVNMQIILDKSCTLLKNNYKDDTILQAFNLEQSIRVSNMMLHDESGKLHQYKSASHILDEFVKVRRVYYQKRKDFLLALYKEEAIIAEEKARFIKMIIDNQLKVQNAPILQLSKQLWENKFMPIKMNRLKLLSDRAEAVDEEQTDKDKADQREAEEYLIKNVPDVSDRTQFFQKVQQPEDKVLTKLYAYLISLAIQSLTKEKYERLLLEKQLTDEKYQQLLNKSVEQLWLYDLAALELAYQEFENNFTNNKTEKAINITHNNIMTQLEAIEKEFAKLPNADAEDPIEPELIIEQKTAKPKADKRPGLLKGLGGAVSKSESDTKSRAASKTKSENFDKTKAATPKSKAEPKAEKVAPKPKANKKQDDYSEDDDSVMEMLVSDYSEPDEASGSGDDL